MFKMNTSTVSVTDYKVINASLAKVVLSFTGKHDKNTIRKSISDKFQGLASVVENSFKIVKPGVAVGFLRANREVRVLEGNELNASYRLMSSNMCMDNNDKSLWAIQEGKAGKYLVRQSQEDLSELIQSNVHHTMGVPSLQHLAIAKAAKSELIAFVNSEGAMDYGFATANKGNQVKLVSFYSRVPRVVDYDSVVTIVPIQVSHELKQKVSAALTSQEKSDAVAYWKKLYGFAPDYLNEVIQQVEEDTVA